jgi:hypothetical protein
MDRRIIQEDEYEELSKKVDRRTIRERRLEGREGRIKE